MQESNFNFKTKLFPGLSVGMGRLAYLSPEVEVQRVELEAAIASSIAGSGGSNPNVDDWTPVDPGTGDNGDLGL